MKRVFRRPSPAMIVASIGVFIAIGGPSYAASQITGKQIKNSSITGTDIKNSSIKSADIKNGSLITKDFKSGSIPAGPAGPAGAAGAPGVAFGHLDYNASAPVTVLDGTQGFVEVACDPGLVEVGGGIYSQGGLGININASYPSTGTEGGVVGVTGWAGYVNNEGGSDYDITAYVACAQASSITKSLGASTAKK
jgi:hypothetical protein